MVALALFSSAARQVLAQSPQANEMAKFEVASIKLNRKPGDVRTPRSSGGNFSASVDIKSLIVMAYQTQDFLISGGPDWLASERYEGERHGQQGAKFGSERYHRVST